MCELNRALQSEPGCEPTDCDRYDYHRRRLVLAKDLDVSHYEMLGCLDLLCVLKFSKATHSTAAVMRNRIWQSEAGYEPMGCDRYEYHR
jgi:hypothetical protein